MLWISAPSHFVRTNMGNWENLLDISVRPPLNTMTRYNANLSREYLMSINTTKRQHKITISFDQQDDDLYYELMRQSTRNMVSISKLSRHWMRGGMNLQASKYPAVVWVMKKNVPISVLAYEMLQELAKKSRPSAKPEVWMENHIKDQYSKLKWESEMTYSTFNEDVCSFKSL